MIIAILFLIIVNDTFAQDQKYNKVVSLSSHNTYQSNLNIEQTLKVVNSIELDLHRSKLFRPSKKNDWYIYHHFLDWKSNTDTFSNALKILDKFSQANKDHSVITVFLDTDGFKNNHSIKQFNNLIIQHLGHKLYMPKHFKESWPNLNTLKNKFIFVLTSGDLDKYYSSENAVAFTASKPENEIKGSLFMNSPFTDNKKWIEKQRMQKRIIRFYHVSKKEIPKSKELGVNFIAIDY